MVVINETPKTLTLVKNTDTVYEGPNMASQDDVHVSPAPTLSIIAVGGFGINIVSKLEASGGLDGSNVNIDHVRHFDTSHANSRKNNATVHIIANGSGSGTVRSANYEEIRRNIPHLSEDELPVSDITVLVFSLGGGTGGVLGPLLVQHLARKGSRVVVFTVLDTLSQISTDNSFKAFKTLQNMVGIDKIYLPMYVADNAQGRTKVNTAIYTTIRDLAALLTTPAYEIDRNDRLSWLNASGTIDATSGIRTLSTYSEQDVLPYSKTVMFESVLSLGAMVDDEIVTIDVTNRSRFRKDGAFATGRDPLLGVITHGTETINHVYRSIDESQKLYASQDLNAKPSQVSSATEAVDSTGTIL